MLLNFWRFLLSSSVLIYDLVAFVGLFTGWYAQFFTYVYLYWIMGVTWTFDYFYQWAAVYILHFDYLSVWIASADWNWAWSDFFGFWQIIFMPLFLILYWLDTWLFFDDMENLVDVYSVIDEAKVLKQELGW